MNFLVKKEPDFECFFDCDDNRQLENGFWDKVLKTRPPLVEFILKMLSNPCFSSIMSWEGTDGQFAIKRPDLVAQLWGERNGRKNMTYQKFSRALRYYYHKKVLTKTRGRKYTYKFNLQELERQYGYKGISSAVISQSSGNSCYGIPSSGAWNADPFPASPFMVRFSPHERHDAPFGSYFH